MFAKMSNKKLAEPESSWLQKITWKMRRESKIVSNKNLVRPNDNLREARTKTDCWSVEPAVMPILFLIRLLFTGRSVRKVVVSNI